MSNFKAWPHFSDDEIEAAAGVLRSGRVNYWTGTEGRKFETEFADFCGTSHAIALANGSVALDLALTALGIGPGDDVIVTPRSYFASVSSVVLAGARPVFADVDRDSQNLTVDTIEAALTEKTRAILPVHLAGWPCDMDAIMSLARRHDLNVIEDCAQAHGATVNGRRVGSFGDVGTFSFCQDKIMTTAGEGGMLTTNDSRVWETAWSYKDHGKRYADAHRDDHPPGFRWLHGQFGTNFRMTEAQAAIGRLQLAKLPDWLETRRRHAALYTEVFRNVAGLRVAAPPPHVGHAYYKYYVFVRPEALAPGWDRDRVMTAVTDAGVPCFQGSCPEIYRESAFDNNGLRPDQPLPVAAELGATSLMLLTHPTLAEADVRRAAETLARVMETATRVPA